MSLYLNCSWEGSEERLALEFGTVKGVNDFAGGMMKVIGTCDAGSHHYRGAFR